MLTTTLKARIAEHPQWYHTLELGEGVVTPGWFDLRNVVDAVGMPASLAGKRCLDVATFDGFWAFEMERRGADGVVGIDLLDPHLWDWPVVGTDEAREAISARKGAGEGFLMAREALGSAVERLELSVYDLDPAVVGTFDFVYVGSLLLHLRDPIRAIEKVRSVCTGQALFVDVIDPILTALTRRPIATFDGRHRPWWWTPNLAGFRRMVEAGGFEVTSTPRRVLLPAGGGQDRPRIDLATVRTLRTQHGRMNLVRARIGDPHGAMLARPLDK